MVRKLLFFSLLIAATCFTTKSQAQSFSMKADTVTETTAGSPTSNWDIDALKMYNWIYNNTEEALVVHWQMFQKDLPSGWKVYGICDNYMCRTEGSDAIMLFAADSTNAIDPDDSSELEPRIAVPATGGNGVGIVKIKVWTADFTDTAVYMIIKEGTNGVTTIKADDKRVALYPNPAGDQDLKVFTEKSLNPAHIEIYNIAGAKQLTTAVNKDKEITSVNVQTLPAGMYLVRVNDSNGNIITTRKLIRK